MHYLYLFIGKRMHIARLKTNLFINESRLYSIDNYDLESVLEYLYNMIII